MQLQKVENCRSGVRRGSLSSITHSSSYCSHPPPCKFTLSVLYFALLFSLSSPEFVPFFCSLFFFGGVEANTTVFLYIKKSCTLNTIQLFKKKKPDLCGLVFSFRVGLQSLMKSSQTFAFCFFCSFPSILPLRCSVSYFEPRRQSDRYG